MNGYHKIEDVARFASTNKNTLQSYINRGFILPTIPSRRIGCPHRFSWDDTVKCCMFFALMGLGYSAKLSKKIVYEP